MLEEKPQVCMHWCAATASGSGTSFPLKHGGTQLKHEKIVFRMWNKER